MKAKDFLNLINRSIAPDSGLRHMTIEGLRDWSETGLLKHGPEYYLGDRLTAIALLRYERDLIGARGMTARYGKSQPQPSAGILQKGCAQLLMVKISHLHR